MRQVYIVIALATIIVGYITGVGAQAPQSFEAPTYSVGDQWTYKGMREPYTITIVEVSGDIRIWTSSRRPGVRYHSNSNGTTVKIEGEPAQVAPVAFLANGWRWLDFPLFVGKKWTFQTQDQTNSFTIDVKVEKLTDIKTKAGTFEALLLDTCWTIESSRWRDCGHRYWYAPQVKQFVKRTTPSNWARSLIERDYELVDYKLAGQ
jgi:hypothetical protein